MSCIPLTCTRDSSSNTEASKQSQTQTLTKSVTDNTPSSPFELQKTTYSKSLMSEQVAVSKINAEAAAGVSLGVIPISSYFLSLKYLWNENATFAAITAVVSANVVLVAYIISAIREDRQTAIPKDQKETPETKKNK
ncbi:hypothetical protein CVT25_010943 [Psilocybe cyanescens]|uniref:Vacuolar ATPase assembly integral membrane protein VMA21 n=1 Tax=Psilocybe cyanescens TaxID=93625 RepID=A0A409WFW0_PSICY|nr:hypothetical protein CVT25_010943 [Psilocybe cyanescens]